MKRSLVIGSRGSKLALWQAEQTKSQLQKTDPELAVRIEIIKTTGDVNRDPLTIIGGKGVFTKELEDALIDGRIDIAVHSLKDLPTILPDKLSIAAICEREDPRDALVLRDSTAVIGSLRDLQKDAVVGTSSQRRLAQLKYLRPDVTIKDLRGNVDTRIRKLDDGEYDALILASAGLRRLGLTNRISLAIATEEMLPAVGQGAIAIETHIENEYALRAVRQLADPKTTAACLAERAFLRSLGGGCQFPIAAHAVIDQQRIQLDGLVASPDGAKIIRDNMSISSAASPEDLGMTLAQKLLDRGANSLLQETYP
jgi:hydroxymethylbilane synthase